MTEREAGTKGTVLPVAPPCRAAEQRPPRMTPLDPRLSCLFFGFLLSIDEF
jgi:hypothetical protein